MFRNYRSNFRWALVPLIAQSLLTAFCCSASAATLRRIDSDMLAHIQAFQPLGPRLEVTIDHDGLYRITYEDLKKLGMPVDELDPRSLAMKCQGQEVAIWIQGEEDGKFDSEDFLLFYGEKFRGTGLANFYKEAMTAEGPTNNWLWQCRDCDLAGMFEKYTDRNIYWLRMEEIPGLRTVQIDAVHDRADPLLSFVETIRAEEQHSWWSHEFDSEETFFWEEIKGRFKGEDGNNNPIERTYQIELPDPVFTLGAATLRLSFASRSESPGFPDHHLVVRVNGDPTPVVSHTWDGKRRQTIETSLPATQLRNGANNIHLSMMPEHEPGKSVSLSQIRIALDWIEITYPRKFRAKEDRLVFSCPQKSGSARISLSNLESQPTVWMISDPFRPKKLAGFMTIESEVGREIDFMAECREDSTFFVSGRIEEPAQIYWYEPYPFSKMEPAEYLVITDSTLLPAVRSLEKYRASQGLTTAILDIADLYREFNFGIVHPIAIKNFLARAFELWDSPPRYVVLVGFSHWNLKCFGDYACPPNNVPPNLAYVDPWQGEVDAPTLLVTLTGQDGIPDLHIGRIPVRSEEEFHRYTEKVIEYERTSQATWRRNHIFVADNWPDAAANFKEIAKSHIRKLKALNDSVNAVEIYLDDFGCTKSNGEGCEEAKTQIIKSLNHAGGLTLTYIGHASLDRWAHEEVLKISDLSRLSVSKHLPLLLSMSCLDGYCIHPERGCLPVELLLSEGGIIGAFSPSGLGLATGHSILLETFFEALYAGQETTLGGLCDAAKKPLWEMGMALDLLYTFTVFGDPALRIK